MAKKSAKCDCCPSENKDWKAESDGRTLKEAQEIRSDAPRYAAAVKKLKDALADTEKAVALEAKVKAGLKAAFSKGD